jgi:hypothetical protein
LGAWPAAESTSKKRAEMMIAKCPGPGCSDDLTQIHGAVLNFDGALQRLKEYAVTFRVPKVIQKGE